MESVPMFELDQSSKAKHGALTEEPFIDAQA
jgi:hypothetical protein